jgi:hypothetical protein
MYINHYSIEQIVFFAEIRYQRQLYFNLTIFSLLILIYFRQHVQLYSNHTVYLCLHIHFISNLTLSITVLQIPDAVDTVVCALEDG